MVSARSERGSVTAEFVVALPAALVVIITALAGVQLGSVVLRLHDASAIVARSVARGDSIEGAQARASRLVPGALFSVARVGDLVCASAEARGRGVLASVPISARSCALSGPAP
ncbi:hypothetical protein [Homoserinimonas hongtaonis]|uniref:hypothetical protein n=1 Tax=Homoserinimonas hongtaonis TaxID=2079791 RepID=UPI001E3DDE3A|nr:hypothetical protein [Salinibacterium hongtaonis]